MKHRKHDPLTDQPTSRAWHPRAYVRRAVAWRVDYATADGRGGLGLIRNLSLQGLYLDHTTCPGAPVVAPGELLTVAFVLPSGRPCKLHAVVVHGHRHGCGVQFRELPPYVFEHLMRYWATLEEVQ